METIVTVTNIHITDSYKIENKQTMVAILQDIKCDHPECEVFSRSWNSLTNEWVAHNRLYKLGLWKSRTKDVDLDVPTKWWTEVIYWILSI